MDRCVLVSVNGTVIIGGGRLWVNMGDHVGMVSESGLNVNPENGLFVHTFTH